MGLIGRRVTCSCGAVFWVCRGCEQNQQYCSSRCQKSDTAAKRRESQRRYASSEKGREQRLKYQRDRRLAIAQGRLPKKNPENIEADRGCIAIGAEIHPVETISPERSNTAAICLFCGHKIDLKESERYAEQLAKREQARAAVAQRYFNPHRRP